jgi:hypothetical protein
LNGPNPNERATAKRISTSHAVFDGVARFMLFGVKRPWRRAILSIRSFESREEEIKDRIR